ncbi:hypothetical protein QR680_017406 [Steinernema hermaphroditum]|uniref:Uncharacterized protein n=1 Tax=Steinernema hermaphroditum TaxID=289476 RepID=A0AA39LNL0_9BILA|nr:hypothetical protein QR680_017406 [Steinernema hermaphroditum]
MATANSRSGLFRVSGSAALSLAPPTPSKSPHSSAPLPISPNSAPNGQPIGFVTVPLLGALLKASPRLRGPLLVAFPSASHLSEPLRLRRVSAAMKIVLCVLIALFAVVAVSFPMAKSQAILRQFLERFPSDEYHPLDRRFAALLEDRSAPPSKRNNAEVVNGILKHFGTLDRLGDVGK